MNTLIKVARYQLSNRFGFVFLPWAIMVLDFVIAVAIVGSLPPSNGHPRYAGALSAIYIVLLVVAAASFSTQLPFALALGVSRRSFYAGTALLDVALATVYGLALTVLQLIERGTGGWGLNLRFFRVTYVMDGPWYLAWATSFVVLALMFVYGMWYGIIQRRWKLLGTSAFLAGQTVVIVAASLVATGADAWASIGDFFTALSPAGLTGILAAVTLALLGAGLATIRRATV